MIPFADPSFVEYLRFAFCLSFSIVFGFIGVCFVIWVVYSFFDFVVRFIKKRFIKK